MAQNVLIAFDCSEGARRAVEYVARVFGNLPDTEITLMYILSQVPAFFWDDGHILDGKERQARQAMVAQWKARQETMCQGGFAWARETLASAGLPRERIRFQSKPLNTDVAGDFIDEAQNGNYDTIVMGRRGLGMAASLIMGSVTSKVVHYARGCAVTVVA